MDSSLNNCISKKIDYYLGIKGRKVAFTRFLNVLNQSDEKAQLFLSSQSDLSWLSQNKDYLDNSRDSFSKTLSKIQKVEVLHSFDRSTSTLLFVINYWIPLYLSGKIYGYNLNDYCIDQPKTTLFLLDNKVCLYSIEPENLDDCITFFFTDTNIISSYKKVFSLMKKSCTVINRKIDTTQNNCYIEVLDNTSKAGNLYYLSHIMSGLFMPVHLYKKVLETIDITKSEQNKRISFYADYFQTLIKNTEKYLHSVILFKNILQEAFENSSVRYNGTCFMENQDILVDKNICLEHLLFICELSEKKRIDVSVIKAQKYANTIPKYDYIIKEDLIVYIYGYSLVNANSNIIVSESDIIQNTLNLLHKNVLQSVPEKLLDFKALIGSGIQKEVSLISNDPEQLLKLTLTRKETEVAKMLSTGMTIKNVSIELCISPNTVKSHLQNIYKKLGINSKYELMKCLSQQNSSV